MYPAVDSAGYFHAEKNVQELRCQWESPLSTEMLEAGFLSVNEAGLPGQYGMLRDVIRKHRLSEEGAPWEYAVLVQGRPDRRPLVYREDFGGSLPV